MIAVSAAHESRSRVRCCVCIERRLKIPLVVSVVREGVGLVMVVEGYIEGQLP
jgi:hypothetical protein